MELGSYMLIEPGMRVVGPEGAVGTVTEVIADESVDVFRGITVSYGLLATHIAFLAPDDIVRVTDSTVQVSVSRSDLDDMPHEVPTALH